MRVANGSCRLIVVTKYTPTAKRNTSSSASPAPFSSMMASNGRAAVSADSQRPRKLQIYPSPGTTGVPPYWREKYERDAKKYWDLFYKRHQDKFFKDRHYLDKEWGRYFSAERRKVVLEVGCGAGNTIFPLVATYPDLFVHACDFSPRAIDMVKAHKNFTETHVNAFVCDLTVDDLSEKILPSSVDIVTMIFVLSAVAPEKMPLVLQNIKKVLKPNGHVLLRDYATGDLAQERLTCKDQQIDENFYVRGDGTRVFYFSEDFLASLFKRNGFGTEEVGVCCKQVENRSREIVMNRRWIQAVFCSLDGVASSNVPNSGNQLDPLCPEIKDPKLTNGNTLKKPSNSLEIDMSESIAIEMFGISPSIDEVTEINLREHCFRIKGLPKEFQHTCNSTGLILWESARLMSMVLAENPSIVTGKRVLELGCGSAGICSMVAARFADLVVATDGDTKTLDMLTQNVTSNLESNLLNKLVVKKLEWGNRSDLKAIEELNHEGFEVIIGTDVTYVSEAISPLFETARTLISKGGNGDLKPALILCHVLRRVNETYIMSAASQFGFRVVDRWSMGAPMDSSDGIICSWFSKDGCGSVFQNTALNIMYFHI